MALLIDIQKDVNGRPPVGGKLYIGTYGTDPKKNPITVYTDRNLTNAITGPFDLDASGRPIDSNGNPVILYSGESYSRQISDAYEADFWSEAQHIEVLDVEPDGNARINIVQPEDGATGTSVGASGNSYEAGYFNDVFINTPLASETTKAANVDFVLSAVGSQNEFIELTDVYIATYTGKAGEVAVIVEGTSPGITSTRTLDNYTFTNTSTNGVVLTAAGSAAQYLNGAGSYASVSISDVTSLQATLDGKLGKAFDINTITGTSYTVVDSDLGKLLAFTNSGAITLNVNTGLDAGGGDSEGFNFVCEVQNATGVITPAGTATLKNAQGHTKTIAADGATLTFYSGANNRFTWGGDAEV